MQINDIDAFLPLRTFILGYFKQEVMAKICENSRETLLWTLFAHFWANKNFSRKSAVFCFESSITGQNLKMNRFREKPVNKLITILSKAYFRKAWYKCRTIKNAHFNKFRAIQR